MKIIEYLNAVGLHTPTMARRIEQVKRFFEHLCPEPLETLFISEYVKDDGTREPESLWFFSKSWVMEAKQFRAKDEFDITLLEDSIRWLQVSKTNYDFEAATETSRMVVTLTFIHGLACVFRATASNTEFLRDILTTILMKNFIKFPQVGVIRERVKAAPAPPQS